MIKAVIEDPENYDYTHCNVLVYNEQGEEVADAFGIYHPGQGSILIGGDKVLTPGQKYRVGVQSIKISEDTEVTEKRYIGDDIIYSDYMVMENSAPPKPVTIISNTEPTVKYSNNNNLKITYNFDQDVNLKVYINNSDILNSAEYKKTWTIDEILEDGDYVITFEAKNKSGDIYSPKLNSDTDALLNSKEIIAYGIDTVIPSLKISSTVRDSLEQDEAGNYKAVPVSNQTVRVKNDKIYISGITEAGSRLTLDGTTEGITIGSSGEFAIERNINMDSTQKIMVLKITDKAGNENSSNIYIINSNAEFIEEINIKTKTDQGVLTDINTADDGYKTLEIETGKTAKLGASAVYNTSDNIKKDVNMNNEDLSWFVLFGDNLMDFNNGNIYAKLPGEAIIKVKHSSSGFKLGTEEQQVSTEDIVRIIIKGEPIYKSEGDIGSSGSRNILADLLNKFIEKVGKQNIIKTIEISKNRQESIVVNNNLRINVLVDSVDKNDILVVYKPEKSEEMKARIKGELLGDIMKLDTVGGEAIKKPIILTYNYGDKNILSENKISLYKYNELYNKWEYVLGQNDTNKNETTVNVDDLNSVYAFIHNDEFIFFEDIKDNWAESYIYALSSLGIINGIQNAENYVFMPEREITRAEFIKLAVSSVQLNIVDYKNTELPFSDKDKIDTWATDYIKAAYAMGWFTGKSAATGLIADASSNITREEAVTVLHRIKDHVYTSDSKEFKDKNNISEFAEKAVNDFASEDILKGYSDGEFKPKNFIKRGETSKVIYQWINYILR